MGVPDNYTKSLLHLDGANTSTDIVDESGKTWTAVATAQLDTAQKKFGTASLLLDGNSDWIYSDDHQDWYFWDGDFTIDFQVRAPAWGAGNFCLTSQFTDTSNAWRVAYFGTGGIYFQQYVTGGSQDITLSQGDNTGWTVDTWHHLAIVRYGNEWDIYLDGTSVANTTSSVTMQNFTGRLYAGVQGAGTPYAFPGWLDEFRVSKGIARWTTNFIPPTHAYGQFPKILTINGVSMVNVKTINGRPIDSLARLQGIQ